jgi:hypothetical protein
MPNYASPNFGEAGPKTRQLQKAKSQIINRINRQEIIVLNNRRHLPPGLQIPNKLLATQRSKANVLLEIAPFVHSTKLKNKGKATTAQPRQKG